MAIQTAMSILEQSACSSLQQPDAGSRKIDGSQEAASASDIHHQMAENGIVNEIKEETGSATTNYVDVRICHEEKVSFEEEMLMLTNGIIPANRELAPASGQRLQDNKEQDIAFLNRMLLNHANAENTSFLSARFKRQDMASRINDWQESQSARHTQKELILHNKFQPATVSSIISINCVSISLKLEHRYILEVLQTLCISCQILYNLMEKREIFTLDEQANLESCCNVRKY